MHTYLSLNCQTQLSIAEAMVTYKERLTDEESCQLFVPFVSDVRVGTFCEDTEPAEHCGGGGALFAERRADRLTPPSSPNISKHGPEYRSSADHRKEEEVMELQLDYWGHQQQSEKPHEKLFGGAKKDDANGDRKQDTEKSKKHTADPKSSIKTTFRNLSISHLAPSQDSLHSFSMTYMTKEKKAKVGLKLGKKKEKSGEKEGEKQQQIEGISRLICMTKSNTPLRVAIDGYEWPGVKFFQLSGQWQTHIKYGLRPPP